MSYWLENMKYVYEWGDEQHEAYHNQYWLDQSDINRPLPDAYDTPPLTIRFIQHSGGEEIHFFCDDLLVMVSRQELSPWGTGEPTQVFRTRVAEPTVVGCRHYCEPAVGGGWWLVCSCDEHDRDHNILHALRHGPQFMRPASMTGGKLVAEDHPTKPAPRVGLLEF
jgi:hypothetical protein